MRGWRATPRTPSAAQRWRCRSTRSPRRSSCATRPGCACAARQDPRPGHRCARWSPASAASATTAATGWSPPRSRPCIAIWSIREPSTTTARSTRCGGPTSPVRSVSPAPRRWSSPRCEPCADAGASLPRWTSSLRSPVAPRSTSWASRPVGWTVRCRRATRRRWSNVRPITSGTSRRCTRSSSAHRSSSWSRGTPPAHRPRVVCTQGCGNGSLREMPSSTRAWTGSSTRPAARPPPWNGRTSMGLPRRSNGPVCCASGSARSMSGPLSWQRWHAQRAGRRRRRGQVGRSWWCPLPVTVHGSWTRSGAPACSLRRSTCSRRLSQVRPRRRARSARRSRLEGPNRTS